MSASASETGKGRFAASLVLLSALIAAVAAICPVSAPAAVGGNHVFDPLLSLTGGTGTSKLDPVPDPGATHPEKPFSSVCGVATDSYGDVYVASMAEDTASGEFINGRIDVFNPAGEFLAEIPNPHLPCSLAVDATGTLYVYQRTYPYDVVRYTPSVYPPTPGASYGSPTTAIDAGVTTIAVNRATGHLLVLKSDYINEYGSAAEGNPLLTADIGKGILNNASPIAVDSASGDIFVGSVCPGCPKIPSPSEPHVSLVYVFAADGTLKGEIDGSDTPEGGFVSAFGQLPVAIDEASGEVFVSDVQGGGPVYRFLPTPGGGYEYAADPELERHSYLDSQIAVANGSGLPNEGNVYVTSNGSPSHLYAFTPEPEVGPPIVGPTTVSNVTSDEARFVAEVNPNGFASEYHFEYVEEATYLRDVEELGAGHGFDHASTVGGGVLAGLHQSLRISASLEGLQPGGAYRVRAVADNHCDPSDAAKACRGEGDEARFLTYPSSVTQGSCPNEALRTGFSAALPDCRAYELVSPSDTNGLAPRGGIANSAFDTPLASPDGESALFTIVGGTLPELDGNGSWDGYRARRSADGWETASAGPSGRQSQVPDSGGASADHGYWFWSTGNSLDQGTLAIGGGNTTYVRLPDGNFRLVGEGPLATDFHAGGLWIAPGGSHIIFGSGKPLAAGASPAGVTGIYDRTLDGETHVVSLKPDGQAPPAGASVDYRGASVDGTAVAFTVTEGGATTLYVRLDNERTVAVAEGATTFAGLSADGARLTYLKGGDVFSFNTETASSTKVGSGGKSTVVNVSADGSHVYFSSTAVLGAGAKAGKDNLYVWEAETESVAFIAVLAHVDMVGTSGGLGNPPINGLGLWVNAVGHGSAIDPSRTTPDGRVIVFSSHADLTGYASNGHAQIYRYEAGEGGGLSCLSCNLTGVAASSDARLQSFSVLESIDSLLDPFAPTGFSTPVANVSTDGRRAFFESHEALVPADVDGVLDVYEWRADGVGACARPAGCLALISSGNSGAENYLYGASASGSDVFFTSSDLLTDADSDDTISIYDARVGGGFPPQRGPAGECLGEACQPAAVAPNDPTPASSSFQGYGNVGSEASKRCPKGRHKVRKGKKTRCLPRKPHKHHKRAHGERRTRR